MENGGVGGGTSVSSGVGSGGCSTVHMVRYFNFFSYGVQLVIIKCWKQKPYRKCKGND